jgi:sterol desaturase/sphingolipid hydroxylase (fatty acid hydroxylase superfamily)
MLDNSSRVSSKRRCPMVRPPACLMLLNTESMTRSVRGDMNPAALSLFPKTAHRPAPWAVTWLTWPLLFGLNLLSIALAVARHWDLRLTLAALTALQVVTLVLLELLYPLDPRWRMTWRSFVGRDLKYFAAGGATGAAINYAVAWLGIELDAPHRGPLAATPLWLSVPIAILAFDFCQYWQHRWSHEGNGPLRRFLWKTHAAHHLPEQVYVLMHPAAHPLNFLLIQGLIRLPLFYGLGLSPQALFTVSALIGLQGVISHCNVDLRAGWLNYLFVGTELHRTHHGARSAEAKNYAVVCSLLDLAFGTFVYRPGQLPERLGVEDPAAYPRSNQFWRVMALPFVQHGKGAAARRAANAAHPPDRSATHS